jgi:hypothetical protein
VKRLWLVVALLLGAHGAVAQQASIRFSASPHYVGVPIDIQVTAEGFERSPEPTIDTDTPAGAVLELVGVSPNISSSVQIINGKMTRSESVRFVYRYRLIPERPGTVEAGPFRLVQGAATAVTNAVRLAIEPIPTTAEQRFRLVIPEGPLWVGQRVPITMEWWLSESFADRLAGRRARVPLFDQVDRFVFEDPEDPKARNTLAVDTAAGTVELPATVRRAQWRDEPYLVVSAQRTLIALKPGEVKIPPASIVTEAATRWSRDFFGNRVPAQVSRLRVQDVERTVVFRTPPAEGRPDSFSGAVGEGFTIAVSADRSVVRTGDPIRLTIDVRGDADLDTVSLPRLADSGLAADDFKIPAGTVAGIVEDGFKRFEVILRANNDQVREIPPIAFSWFNPELGQYETTRSRPIALSVRPATVVSAADVVSARTESDGGDPVDNGQADLSAPSAQSTAVPSRPAFSLSGAELAIETRPEVLGGNPVPWYGQPVTLAAMYLSGLIALGAGIMTRRRAVQDPGLRARRQTLEDQRRRVADASSAADVARALRRMAATASVLPRDEYDALLVECDNLAYAPNTGSIGPLDPRLRTRALAVADAILEGAQ